MNELQTILQNTEKNALNYEMTNERMRLKTILQIEKQIKQLEKRKLLLERGCNDVYGDIYDE